MKGQYNAQVVDSKIKAANNTVCAFTIKLETITNGKNSL